MELEKIKIFIGPVSKNIVDSVIKYCNDTNNVVGLIPSRRQIDYKNGYVGWDTKEFVKYIREKTKNVLIERDHSGIGQGSMFDSGSMSQHIDATNDFDIIHIDPWKMYNKYDDGLSDTIECIKYIHSINPNCLYEVGTEEAIKNFSVDEFETFLTDLKSELGELFYKIRYAVIQSGTRLIETKNIGEFDIERLKGMINVCNKFGLLSKEHNGDYLQLNQIKSKFDSGLSAINIAPEFGVFETDILLDNMNEKQKEIFYDLCHKSGKWENWVDEYFEPHKNKNQLMRICGHYQFNSQEFKDMNFDLDNIIKERLYKKIKKLVEL